MEYAWNFIRESLSEACRYEKAAMEELSHVGLERLTDKIAEEEYPQYEAMNQAADSKKKWSGLENLYGVFLLCA